MVPFAMLSAGDEDEDEDGDELSAGDALSATLIVIVVLLYDSYNFFSLSFHLLTLI